MVPSQPRVAEKQQRLLFAGQSHVCLAQREGGEVKRGRRKKVPLPQGSPRASGPVTGAPFLLGRGVWLWDYLKL